MKNGQQGLPHGRSLRTPTHGGRTTKGPWLTGTSRPAWQKSLMPMWPRRSRRRQLPERRARRNLKRRSSKHKRPGLPQPSRKPKLQPASSTHPNVNYGCPSSNDVNRYHGTADDSSTSTVIVVRRFCIEIPVRAAETAATEATCCTKVPRRFCLLKQ